MLAHGRLIGNSIEFDYSLAFFEPFFNFLPLAFERFEQRSSPAIAKAHPKQSAILRVNGVREEIRVFADYDPSACNRKVPNLAVSCTLESDLAYVLRMKAFRREKSCESGGQLGTSRRSDHRMIGLTGGVFN